jgi:hypothetical protein
VITPAEARLLANTIYAELWCKSGRCGPIQDALRSLADQLDASDKGRSTTDAKKKSNKNKLYFVHRGSSCGYDEYDSAVVCANSASNAIEIVYANCSESSWPRNKKDYAELIKSTKPGMIVGSFNAG